ITGSKHNSIKIPSSIIKDREKFWNEFFFKYSEQEFEETELNIFTLKSNREKSQNSIVETKKELVCKPLSVIQYWINTGYLPYKTLYMNKDKSDVELFTESTNSSHPRSSSSSVDTAAYILSNMNVTNKIETMAIIEGAKDNSVITSQSAQDIGIIQDKMHEINNENNNENVILKNNNGSIILENNDSSANNIQQKNINVEEYITKAQRNSDNDDVDILSETINTDNETTDKYKSDYNKLLNKQLTCIFDDINRNSHTEQNVKLSNAEQPYLIKENLTLADSFTKIGRKKLYTGRDSPIDLINIESSNRSIISISDQSLHPAFDFGYKSSKKFKIYNKRKMYHSAPFHKLINNNQSSVLYHNKHKRRIKRRTSLTNVIKDTVSINQNITDRSMLNQYLVKGKIDKCVNSSFYKKQANKRKKLNESINCLQEMNIGRYQKTNNTSKELENLNPLVYLTRLSNDDIVKYKKLKKTTNNNNLDTIRLLEVNTKKYKRSNKMTNMKHLVIRLSRLSKHDIEKYKKPNNIKLNLNPVVRLKRLSEFEIKKYTKSTNMMKSSENLDTVTSLNRILSKSDVSLKSTQLQNDSANDVNQFSSSNIMNLMTEDNTSEESTLFICKCDSIAFDDCSIDNSSMFSRSSLHSCSTTIKSHMLQKKKRFYNKRKRLNSEVCNKKINTSKKAYVKKGVKRLNNKRSLKLNTSKSNLKREYATRDRKYTKVYSMDNSFSNNSKISNINKDVLNTNDIAVCPDKPRIVFENNNANTNNKKRQYIMFSSDEDDEFMKLVHSEDMQKSKLRKRHETLNKNFNTVEKLEITSSNESLSDSPIKNTRFKGMDENCNEKLIKVRTEIKSQTKLLPMQNKRKSLCFRTKIFDSDSESLTASQCSFNLSVDNE
ncbi:unnamed protein product, partial [Heterotrigona itama]